MRRQGLLVFLAVSLGINLLLAAGWALYALRPREPVQRLTVVRPVVTNVLEPIRTNLTLKVDILTWQEIESDDYPTYIANLRLLGCPEQTIRDIIIADVNQVYARRREAELSTPAQGWWITDPEPALPEAADSQAEALEAERRQLLDELLGPGWEASLSYFENRDRTVPLDGPLLGELPAETKRTVREIGLRSLERLSALEENARVEGREVPLADVAREQQQLREELAAVLQPDALEEYLLRYSPNAQAWREELQGFQPTKEEFRALFRTTDEIDRQLALLADANDAPSIAKRERLEKEREEATRQALGPERFAYYRVTQDPLFQQARQTALEAGAPVETVMPLYEVNHATDEERRRILSDTALTPEQQSEQLAAIQQARLDTLRALLGEATFQELQLRESR
jgi:hypothetical protein